MSMPNREAALFCESCGGKLEVDPTKTIAKCSYCGTCYSVSGLLNESDEVKIAKIQFQTYHDVELGNQRVLLGQQEIERIRLQVEARRLQQQREKERGEAFRKSTVSKLLIVCALISLASFVFFFPIGDTWVGIIAIIQAILFIVSIILGNLGKRSYILTTIIGFVLIILFFKACD